MHQIAQICISPPDPLELGWLSACLTFTQSHPWCCLAVTDGEQPGLKQEDFQASVATLRSITESLGLECVQLRERNVEEGIVAEYLLRQKLDSEDFMEIR